MANGKQLKTIKRHCTTIIRLIKQDALNKKKRKILTVSYDKNKVNFYLQVFKSKAFVGICIKIKKIGIVPSLISCFSLI